MPKFSLGQTIGSVSSKLGNALMQVAQTTEARTNRAYDLARQGRLDAMAMQRIQMDHEMLTESRKRTADLLESQGHARGRAASDIIRSQANLGYTPQLAEGQTLDEFASALGTGQVGEWAHDPKESGAYRQQEELGDLATEQAGERYEAQTPQLLERAQTMGAAGYTAAGQPITAPRETPAWRDEDPRNYITMRGRRFDNTPEGRAAAKAWDQEFQQSQDPWWMQGFGDLASQGGTPAVDAGMEGGIGGVVGAVPGTRISPVQAQQVVDALNLAGDSEEVAYAIEQGAGAADLAAQFGTR